MFYLIQKVFSPSGKQIDSDSIAEYATEIEAQAEADKLTSEQRDGPMSADDNFCRWHVEAA
jgi:hypothetical protein